LLTAGTLAYLVSLPFGWVSYRRYQRRSREGMAETTREPILPSPIREGVVRPNDQTERPSRLN
jgi:CDP-diacylglycerol---serine O-phosphatidyltransferase